MATNFFVADRRNRTRQPVEFRQPIGKAQVAHATTVIAAGLEAGSAASDQAVIATDSPAGGGAQIEGQDGAVCVWIGSCRPPLRFGERGERTGR